MKRLDYDTTRKKNSFERLISDFENQKIDILIGTQMITKGLDFKNVKLALSFFTVDINFLDHWKSKCSSFTGSSSVKFLAKLTQSIFG